jgi:hypothetical protein
MDFRRTRRALYIDGHGSLVSGDGKPAKRHSLLLGESIGKSITARVSRSATPSSEHLPESQARENWRNSTLKTAHN